MNDSHFCRKRIAKPEQIHNIDVIAAFQQLWYQRGSYVSSATCHQDGHQASLATVARYGILSESGDSSHCARVCAFRSFSDVTTIAGSMGQRIPISGSAK